MERFNKKFALIISSVIFLGLSTNFTAVAQNGDEKEKPQDYPRVEELQDENAMLKSSIYDILEEHPGADWEYTYSGDELTGVTITGIDNGSDKRKLKDKLLDLKKNKEKLKNLSTRTGIYYEADENAEPDMGYNDFFTQLYENLTYPDDMVDAGVEGVVYVKFLVDKKGEIDEIKVTEDIEGADRYVNQLRQEAKQAIKETSGKWEPAKDEGEPVKSWVMVPVQFKKVINPALKAPIS